MNCEYCKRDLSKARVAFNTPSGYFCDHDCMSDFELGYKPKERDMIKTPCCGKALNTWSRHHLECGHCGMTLSQKEIDDAVELARIEEDAKDSINPSHYKSHASGIECIQITEHMSFTLGNAIKYIWRADLKHDDGGIEDLKKALWYLKRELDKRQSQLEKRESSA